MGALQASIQAAPAPTASNQAVGDNKHALEASVALGPCRLACFIASAPNCGIGATSDSVAPLPAQAGHPGHFPVASFEGEGAVAKVYEQIGIIAAMSGVSVDVFGAGPSPLGLHALAPLCLKSGGSCFFYGDIESSSLPQV